MNVRISKALEWLWSQNGTEMSFNYTIFTEQNKEHKFEKLNIKESQNLIMYLLSKNLIHKNETGDGYVINSLMCDEWGKLLKELKSGIIGGIVNFTCKHLTLFIVAAIGGIFGGLNGTIGAKIFDFVANFFK